MKNKKLIEETSIKPSELVCPSCLTNINWNPEQLYCTECDQSYPLLNKKIPYLICNPKLNLAKNYIHYFNLVNRQDDLVRQIEADIKDGRGDSKLLRISYAIARNNLFFEELKSSLKPTVDLDIALENFSKKADAWYGDDFKYLSRDWSNNSFYEEEIKIIEDGVRSALRFVKNKEKALFLGMGTGRFALDLCDNFETSWGLDNSLAQVLQFYALLDGGFSFYELNTINETVEHNKVKKIQVSLPNKYLERAKKVNYLCGDATATPFRDNFFSTIFSIHFSDVPSLSNLGTEIDRILNPKGYFLHVGPLQYHSQNFFEHLALDEFRQFFIDKNFEIRHESEFTAPVLFSPTSLRQEYYLNKVILFQKK